MSSINPYEILGVAKDADDSQIKKAYRKLAVQHHPDKGGSTEMFNQIAAAYEILSNPEKRKLYDLGGMDAVDRGHAGGDDGGMDIFDLFGGGGRRRGPRGPQTPRKGDPVDFPLQLTLEEMYTGCSRKLRLTRSLVCSGCDGKGGKGVAPCQPCQGRGVRVVVQRLGPGMITQSQTTCDRCRGEGQVIAAGQECTQCVGQKTVKEKKTLDVTVPRGARPGQVIIFPSEGDQQPGQLPGDINVVFQTKDHAYFQRRGHHLYYNQKISLLEALTGFSFYITQLDGRELKIESKSVIKPGDVMCIPEEGFPHSFGNGRGIETGNLYVTFDVEFPTTQQIQQKGAQGAKSLISVLPNKSVLKTQTQAKAEQITQVQSKVIDMVAEEKRHNLEERDWERYRQQQDRQQSQQQAGGFDDDGEEGGHAHMSMGPGCQPM